MISPTLNTDSTLIAAGAGGEIASLDRFIAAARKLSLMKRISDASPSVHVAMLMLHAVVALQAAVLLPVASAMDKLHRAVRHDARGRVCGAAALQIALAEQRQLCAAACHRGRLGSFDVDGELNLVRASWT